MHDVANFRCVGGRVVIVLVTSESHYSNNNHWLVHIDSNMTFQNGTGEQCLMKEAGVDVYITSPKNVETRILTILEYLETIWLCIVHVW